MKVLYLARHSVPEKNTDVETREIPLSNEGRGKALVFLVEKSSLIFQRFLFQIIKEHMKQLFILLVIMKLIQD